MVTPVALSAISNKPAVTNRARERLARIWAVREMILADDEAGRKVALEKLLPMQREDFIELFEIMAGLPVTIRLLDPPIHEFLPSEQQLVAELEQLSHLKDTVMGMNVLSEAVEVMYREDGQQPTVACLTDPRLVDEAITRKEAMLKKVRILYEVNPML